MRPLQWVVVLAVSGLGVGCQRAQSVPELPLPSTQSLTIEPETLPPPPPTETEDGAAKQRAVNPPVVQPVTQPATTPTEPEDVPVEPPPATEPATTATQEVTTEPTTEPTTAPAVAPAVAPVTEPATTQVESPKAALAGVMNATVRGDVEGVRNRLFIEGEEAERMAAAMVEVAEAAKKVRDASAEKFGWDSLKVLDIEIVPPLLLAGATEQVEGDRATVQFPGQGAGMVMRQVNGGWKLSVPELVEVQKRTREIDQVIDEARDPAQRLSALAERVAAGEFETIEQVHQALAQSLFAAGETVKKQ